MLPLIEDYRWAVDIEICVFPQEGLLNNPGTDELMVEALRRAARAVGASPYTDSDPHMRNLAERWHTWLAMAEACDQVAAAVFEPLDDSPSSPAGGMAPP